MSNQKIKNEEFESRMINVARVTRVVAGGRRFRFRVVVVVGNKNGQVGVGIAKGKDVAMAVNKATRLAKGNLIRVNLVKGTIPHEVEAKYKSAVVLLKPAPEGKGIIAGGPPRAVLELAGVKNVIGKIISRSANPINNARAVLKAFQLLKKPRLQDQNKEIAFSSTRTSDFSKPKTKTQKPKLQTKVKN